MSETTLHEALERIERLTVALERAERERDEYAEQWAELSSNEFLDYWHTIGYSCTAGTAIKALLAERQKAEAVVEAAREERDRLARLLLDIEGGLLGYWTDIPESVVDDWRIRIRIELDALTIYDAPALAALDEQEQA